MTAPDIEMLDHLAAECARLVATDHDRRLDGSLASLAELDEVCWALLADGPLAEDRLRLWWQLAGAYTGRVLVQEYGGTWIDHEGSLAVEVSGVKAFPFSTAHRVLSGEEGKSLASLARALPVIIDRQGRS
ncbi:hypothetical protein [Actinoallomurus acaciae]|uniref:DUF3806 domain-containing protein n=1 Tax=Actinoallomurus acaciae TaxID=502577 RepID=A0ABV5YEQ7_9ACTN